MANHVSALKRERQAGKRRARNRAVVSGVRTTLKKVQTALAEGQVENIQSAVKAATSALGRAASKGVLPKKRVSRKISRMAQRANQALHASTAPPPS